METQTQQSQQELTSNDALQLLVEGNKRFVNNSKADRDLKKQVLATSEGQYPFGVVLSCIDSRVPTELVFDQGIGDVFNARVAGNIINPDILGSMEYACKVAGSKVIVVLGHTKCGAVTSACKHIELGNITPLLNHIKPIVKSFEEKGIELAGDAIEEVSKENVFQSIRLIREESPILKEMEDNGDLIIVGAMYDVSTGMVEFYN